MTRSIRPYHLVVPAPAKPFSIPKDAAELWSLFLRDKAETTRENYSRDLDCFARFVEVSQPVDAIRKLIGCSAPEANATVVAYVAHLRQTKFYRADADPQIDEPFQVGYAPATINRRIYALKAVVELAQLCGLITWKILVKQRKAEPVRDTRGCGPGGYGKLLTAIEQDLHRLAELERQGKDRSRRREIALRDRVILRLLHDSGLRRAETTRIEWPLGVRFGDKREVLVLGKGRTRTRWVSISSPCEEAIHAYLEVRGQRRGYLLQGTAKKRRHVRMSLSTVNRRVDYWGERAAVSTTPHGLRHTAATRVLDEVDGDYRVASQWSRHEDPGSLRAYDDARRDDARRLTELIADPSSAREPDE